MSSDFQDWWVLWPTGAAAEQPQRMSGGIQNGLGQLKHNPRAWERHWKMKAWRDAELMELLGAGHRMTTDVSFTSSHLTKFYRCVIFNSWISFLFSSSFCGFTSWEVQTARTCSQLQIVEITFWRKTNWYFKISIFSQKRIFWKARYLLGNHCKGKITTGYSSDADRV